MLLAFVFGARGVIVGTFQAIFVYTPEVRRKTGGKLTVNYILLLVVIQGIPNFNQSSRIGHVQFSGSSGGNDHSVCG